MEITKLQTVKEITLAIANFTLHLVNKQALMQIGRYAYKRTAVEIIRRKSKEPINAVKDTITVLSGYHIKTKTDLTQTLPT